MKSLLTISIPVDFEIVPQKGDKVKVGEILAKKKSKGHKEKIPLSKILSISPKNTLNYLKRKLGSKIKKGEIIAKKDSFLKSIQVLSPFSGIIDSIDLKDGSLLLVQEEVKEMFEIVPVTGEVDSIVDSEVTLSFEGKVIEGEKGKGGRAVGNIVFFDKHTDLFDFASEVCEKIIIGRSFSEGAVSKLLALNAKGIVALEIYEHFPISIALSLEKLEKVLDENPKNIIILGDKKRVVIPVAKI